MDGYISTLTPRIVATLIYTSALHLSGKLRYQSRNIRSCTIFEQNLEPKSDKKLYMHYEIYIKTELSLSYDVPHQSTLYFHSAQNIKFPILIVYHPGNRGYYAYIHDSLEKDMTLYPEEN